jgi:hypothetical protein
VVADLIVEVEGIAAVAASAVSAGIGEVPGNDVVK